jgi:signal transduction histidine kinase
MFFHFCFVLMFIIVFETQKGFPTILVAHPIFHSANIRPIGVLAANIRLKELWEILSTLSGKANVSAYLLDSRGYVVAHPNSSVVSQGTYLDHPEKDGLRKGLLKKWSVLVGHELFLGDQKFFMVVEQPLKQALSDTIKTTLLIGITITLTCICAVFLAVMKARQLIKPIDRLTLKARQISKGDLVQLVDLDDRDEFGLLAQAFNSMSTALEGQIHSLNQMLVEKERAFQSLSDSYAEMEELSYIISHHLQEPVRIIANYTELIDKKYGERLDNSGKRYLFHIHEKSIVLKRMLNDVMEYLSLNQVTIKKEAVDVEAIASRALKTVVSRFPNQNVIINVDTSSKVHTDGRLLERVLVQLLDNALKYNDKNTQRVDLKIESTADGWVISVSDNGIGVDAEYREKVFKIFNRLHSQQDYPGTGIGLSLCRKIISMLGGNFLRMESNENSGTCVVFHLPARIRSNL